MLLPKDTMFAVLISTNESDIRKYEKEVGFARKDKQVLIDRMDEVTGIKYTRYTEEG
jgi:hypothetical protein